MSIVPLSWHLDKEIDMEFLIRDETGDITGTVVLYMTMTSQQREFDFFQGTVFHGNYGHKNDASNSSNSTHTYKELTGIVGENYLQSTCSQCEKFVTQFLDGLRTCEAELTKTEVQLHTETRRLTAELTDTKASYEKETARLNSIIEQLKAELDISNYKIEVKSETGRSPSGKTTISIDDSVLSGVTGGE